jgi:nicotinate-nucleotide adenylyltransferase
MRLGIFGGTFDPPHIAHLVLAAEAQAQLSLNKVLWVLTLNPPHKESQSISELIHRQEMLQAAIDPDPNFKLSRVDIDRPAPHYAVDTMQILRSEHPSAELIYLMGADSLLNLNTWYKPNEFIMQCDGIGVMGRPGWNLNAVDYEQYESGLASKAIIIDTPLIEISATQIRQRIRQNRPYRYLVPREVYDIIWKRNLYREP